MVFSNSKNTTERELENGKSEFEGKRKENMLGKGEGKRYFRW